MITSPNQQEVNVLSRSFARGIPFNWETAAYIVILLLALFTRFHMLDARVMSHDESLHTRFSYNLYNEGNFQHTPLMHGPVLFHATALSYYLFGDDDFSGRLYTAILGVLMVMFPLLLRRWLGRWGALLASVMLLISPLLLYYNRYIRHDTPSILFGMIMAYCVLQYLDGSPRFRRRAYWLYIFSAAMLLNLGSKETAFIYIAIFGSFLAIYFFVRLAEFRYSLRGRPIFYAVMLGILLGGMMTLGMYIVVDIISVEILPGRGTAWGDLTDLQQRSWLSWMALSILSGLFVLASTALYAFRERWRWVPWRELAVIFLIALITAGGLLFIEELSHFPTPSETAEPVVPDADVAVSAETEIGAGIRWAPALALWAIAIVAIVYLVRDSRRAATMKDKMPDDDYEDHGLWGFLANYPEVDFLVIIITLILPWTTALFTRLMGGTSADFAGLGESLPTGIYDIMVGLPNLGSPAQLGQFIVGVAAFLPLLLLSLAIGLTWHWRRWLISAAIFHLLFAFFFTTVFTNISGLGTGMIYSLGYWLEQQGVRRGSQPQYYYLLIILPTYEFLPIVGSVSAMFAGVTCYWKTRRKRITEDIDAQRTLVASEAAALVTVADTDGDPNAGDVEAQALSRSIADSADSLEPDKADSAEPDDDAALTVPATVPAADKLSRLPFLLLLAWWAILNLVGYSLAGEKMPWLGTHLTTPMILITAWYFGGIFARIDRSLFLARGWIALLVLLPFVLSLTQVLGAFAVGDPPFAGLERAQLERTYAWLAALTVSVVLAYVLVRLARLTNWRHIRRLCAVTVFALLSVVTFRAGWMASFINYDLPTELLVYAHAAPAVKWVLDDIEEMSLRMTDGKDLKFVYDDEVSWPYSWYFRDFTDAVFVGANPTVQNTQDAIFVIVGSAHRGDVEPILEDRYLRRDHMRMWWPMQEYFGLTPQRLLNTFDLSPANEDGAALRKGIFDIWWSRDYDAYGKAAGKDFSLTNWPVSDRMHVYVRKDFASMIWEYGIGEGDVPSNLPTEVNQCTANWQQISPLLSFETSAQALLHPLALAVAGDEVFVADENGNRVVSFDNEGRYLRTIDGAAAAGFNRPNSVAILPAGDLLVVDTWNYAIKRIDASGALVTQWGSSGEFGFDAPVEPSDAFWGPRDVAIDAEGRVFIADTGNKRVRVYRLDDEGVVYEYDIGRGGSGPGELDEPSGLALHSDGRLFVADTWNRRVAVFDVGGTHLFNFRVRGWYENTFNRPYLAIDERANALYITDPDGKRVLVYDLGGECIGSFGESGDAGMLGQFVEMGGIAVDESGYVYISDSSAGTLHKYPPFPFASGAQ